jgi:glycosyltransferase involved in cell wall biosynthesis
MSLTATDAVVVTYKRPKELRRLIESLSQGSLIPRRIFVVDNSPQEEASGVCRDFPSLCSYIAAGENVGVGAGFNIGLRALSKSPPEFVCALDDDCIVSRSALAELVAALKKDPRISFAAPLVSDGNGHPAVRPGFVSKAANATFKNAANWNELKKLEGSLLRWATGVCLLYRYQTAANAGFYRDDCWVLGEDIEFTLRMSYPSPGSLVATEVAHVPPTEVVKALDRKVISYAKFLALLTNMSFFATRLAHARRELLSVPKIFGKFLLTAPGIRGRLKFVDAIRAVWIGAVKGQPAGGELFKRSFKSRLIPNY